MVDRGPRSLGLASGHVSLARSHDEWARAFEAEKARIVTALRGLIVGVEHVGSTSIPNVPAKPILDVLVGVADFEEARVCIEPLTALGYVYRGENGIPRRHYFVRGDPRTHHLHMVEVRSEAWASMLGFRDRLRAAPELARRYAKEKERLAKRYARDRKAYQREKGTVVERILDRSSR